MAQLKTNEAIVGVPLNIREHAKVARIPGEPHKVRVLKRHENGDIRVALLRRVGSAPKGTIFEVRSMNVVRLGQPKQQRSFATGSKSPKQRDFDRA